MLSGPATGDVLFESVFDAAAVGMAIVDSDGRLARCNRAFQCIIGYDQRALLGRHFVEFNHPDDAAAEAALLAGLLAGQCRSYELTKRYVHSAGRIVHADVTASCTASGVIVATIKDVSSEWDAREELRRSRERLGLVLDSIDMGFWEWDVLGDHIIWSEEMSRLCGLGSTSVEGRFGERFYLIHPDDQRTVSRTVHEGLAGTDSLVACEFRIVRPNGDERWVVGKGYIFRDDAGKPLRVVGAIIDITRLRILREEFLQAQKMEAVGRFVSGIAHDFNNALMVIVGQCDVLGMGKLTPAMMRRGVREISDAAERAAHLTQQLLTFSRKGQPDPQVLDPNATLRRLEAFLKPLIGGHRLRLTLSRDVGWIVVDERQLEQAIVNLVVNARDAMPEKSEIEISTGNMSDGRVFVGVRDWGIGIDAATRKRLFEPFFTTKAPGQGTGLGLPVVLAVMEAARGEVHVESAPGAGTLFELRFPQAR